MNSPFRSSLAKPALPVSVMRGKKAARAAPMLALAAFNCRSARWISGRRSSSSDGRPAGKSASRPCACQRQAVGQPRARRLAQQQHQRIEVLRALALQQRERRARAFDQRHRLREVVGRGHAVVVAQFLQAVAVFARGQCLARHLKLLVIGQHRAVAVGHCGHQADLYRLARLLGGEELLQRRIAQAAHAAEQIELVRRRCSSPRCRSCWCRCPKHWARPARWRRASRWAARWRAESGTAHAPARC